MVTKPRHVRILDLLKGEPTVLVRDLADQIEVSESTIRRDLDELAEQGLVRRLYGGVVLDTTSHNHSEPPFELRQISHTREKELVGRAAAALVDDGDVIFVDGGTTTPFMVPHLLDRKNLTVLTCGLNVASALANTPGIHTIAIGGELHCESQCFAGPLALEAFEVYHVRCDKAFMSAGGVSAEYGITNRILDRIALKRRAMESSRMSVVVVDGSKVGLATLGHVAPIEAAHYLVTDDSAPEHEVAAITGRGVQVRLATDVGAIPLRSP